MPRSETAPLGSISSAAQVSAAGQGIFLVQIGILIFTLALFVVPSNVGWKDRDVIYPYCVFLFLHAGWAFWSWKRLQKTLFDPYALTFLSALIFNGGQAILEVFGLNEGGLLDGEFNSAILARTVLITFAGLVGLHSGAIIAVYISQGKRRLSKETESPSQRVAIRSVGWSLLAISAIPLAFQLKEAVSTVLAGGYMALYQRQAPPAGIGSAMIILSDFVAPGAFFLMAGSKGRRLELLLTAVVLLTYASILLFLGFRAYSVMPLVAAAWLWERCIRRLPRALLTVMAAIVLIGVFPLVRETRLAPGTERTSASVLLKTYSSLENPLVSIVSEMGKSMAPLAHTLELIPFQRQYDLGVGYAYSLLTVVPSVFWNRHPTVVRGTPANWLIETIDPYQASQGGGIGFSFIAEAFLNFGGLGVPLVTFLMGYLLVRFCIWADQIASAARLVVVATFLPHLLLFARGDSTDLPRALIWLGLAPYAVYLILERSQRLRARQTVNRIVEESVD